MKKKYVSQITIITQGEESFNVEIKVPQADITNSIFPVDTKPFFHRPEYISDRLICHIAKSRIMIGRLYYHLMETDSCS